MGLKCEMGESSREQFKARVSLCTERRLKEN